MMITKKIVLFSILFLLFAVITTRIDDFILLSYYQRESFATLCVSVGHKITPFFWLLLIAAKNYFLSDYVKWFVNEFSKLMYKPLIDFKVKNGALF